MPVNRVLIILRPPFPLVVGEGPGWSDYPSGRSLIWMSPAPFRIARLVGTMESVGMLMGVVVPMIHQSTRQCVPVAVVGGRESGLRSGFELG